MIGSALANFCDSLNISYYKTTRRIDNKDKLGYIYLDLLKPETFSNILNYKFDILMICTGLNDINLCDQNPIITQQVNVQSLTEIIKLLPSNISKIVFLSTDKSTFITHDKFKNNHINKTSEYVRQKSDIEKIIHAFKDRGLVLRLSKIIHQNKSGIFNNWVNNIFHQNEIEALYNLYFSPITLDYCVSEIMKAYLSNAHGINYITSREYISYYTAAEYIIKNLNFSNTKLLKRKYDSNENFNYDDAQFINSLQSTLNNPSPYDAINNFIKWKGNP